MTSMEETNCRAPIILLISSCCDFNNSMMLGTTKCYRLTVNDLMISEARLILSSSLMQFFLKRGDERNT